MKFKLLRHLIRAGICVVFVSPLMRLLSIWNVFPHPHEVVIHHCVNKVASGFPSWGVPLMSASSVVAWFQGGEDHHCYTGFLPAPLLLLLLSSKIDWFSSMPFPIPRLLPGRGINNNDQKKSKKAAAGGRGGTHGLDHSHGPSLPKPCSLVARGKICQRNLPMRTLENHTKTQ